MASAPPVATPAPRQLEASSEGEEPWFPGQSSLAARHRLVPVELTCTHYRRGDGYEIVGLSVPLPNSEARTVVDVALDGPGLGVMTTGAVFGTQEGTPGPKEPVGPTLWVFVPGYRARQLTGTFVRALEGEPGELIPFRVVGGFPAPLMGVERFWVEALQARFGNRESAFDAFVTQRVADAWLPRATAVSEAGRSPVEVLGLLMQPLDGGADDYEAQLGRMSWRRDTSERRTQLPLSQLKAPDLMTVPYERLTHPASAVEESLAAFVPRDFYYLRALHPESLATLQAHLENWLFAVNRINGHVNPFPLSRQMERMGLPGDFVGRLESSDIEQLALIGSDLEFGLGSDLTLLLSVRDPAAKNRVLERVRELVTQRTGAAPVLGPSGFTSSRPELGVSLQVRIIDDLVLLSNSEIALRRVELASQTGRLADEPDFIRLSRGADDDVFLYLGSAFIARQMSPQHRILSQRRRRAHAELRALLFAELFYGNLFGRLPQSRRELTGTRLILPGELQHFDGQRISYEPGEQPRSAWGQAGALRPLIELPVPTSVSPAERKAYEQFAERLEQGAGVLRAPVSVGFRVQDHPRSPTAFEFDVRILPLHPGHLPYVDWVGGGRVQSVSSLAGLWVSTGLGEQGAGRRLVNAWLARELGSGGSLGGDIDSIQVGMVDSQAAAESLASVLATAGNPRELQSLLPRDLITSLPMVLSLGSSRGTATKWLHRFRRAILETFGDSAAEHLEGVHQGHEVWQVQLTPAGCRRESCKLSIFVMASESQAVAAFQLSSLLRFVHTPAFPPTPTPAQFSLRANVPGSSGLSTLLGLQLEQAVRRRPGPHAGLVEALFSGDQGARRSRQYAPAAERFLGWVPLTPDAGLYERRPGEVADPERGSRPSPVLRSNPVPASPLAAVRRALSELAIDVEFETVGTVDGAPLRALHLWGKLGAGEERPP